MSKYRWEVHEARKSSRSKEFPPTPPKGIREVRDGLPKRPSTVRWKMGGRIPQNGKLDTDDKDFPLGLGIEWPRTDREEKMMSQQKYDSGWRWNPFFVGIACSSLFWGLMFHLFGG